MTEQPSIEPGDAFAPTDDAQLAPRPSESSTPVVSPPPLQGAGGEPPQHRRNAEETTAAGRPLNGDGLIGRDIDPVADGLREQLAHRLGSELIAATRSVPALLGLPFALRRAFRQHGQAMQAHDLSRQTSRPPATNGIVVAEPFHGQLAYRLGAELVAVRSPLSALRLPFALHRAYRGFKRDRNGTAGGNRGLGVITRLETRLWGGYARYALPELQTRLDDAAASERLRSATAHALARWHYAEGAFEQAAELMARSLSLSRDNLQEKRLCQLLCLLRAGRPHEAEARLKETPVAAERRIDFALVGAEILRRRALVDGVPAGQCDRLYLAALNEAMAPSGMSPIELADPDQPLSIWNIASHSTTRAGGQDAKVSVIIPAYNAEKTLAMVLDSLAAQTWRNLEIIVVDDVSTDATCDLVARYAAKDPRIRLVRRARNGGAYPARNDGLEVATGDLVTVCDSDDWSHPEKIERQMQALADRPDCVAVVSQWLRVHDDLGLAGPWIPKLSVLDLNLSSLLVRREVFDRLRGWDEVRVTGDAELRARIEAVYGPKAICKVRHDNVLSFSLVRDDSLTRSAATHVRSLRFGVRALYRDSYRNWHNSLRHGGDPHLPRSNGRYPVPLGNRRAGKGVGTFDIVFVSDFALKGGAFVSTLNYMKAAIRAGLKIAALHWRKYELDTDSPLNPLFYEACLQHGVELLTDGDVVSSRHVIVGYPAILQQLPDRLPQIDCENVIVVINQFATRLVDGSDRQYDPEVAKRHLIEAFGSAGTWVPISHWVRRLMLEDETYPPPHPQPWHPMIDTETWCAGPIRWRPSGSHRPVLGRHGRDAYTKWPGTVDAIKKAYCVDADVEVRFLGGARHAIRQLGYTPENWDVRNFGATAVDAFLEGLDFLVHFPHELYIEEFGRTVMEAMAMGRIAILPHQFRETFGDAAVYCEPDEVLETVHRYWMDEDAYLAQASRGRDFVRRHCSQGDFIARLDALTT